MSPDTSAPPAPCWFSFRRDYLHPRLDLPQVCRDGASEPGSGRRRAEDRVCRALSRGRCGIRHRTRPKVGQVEGPVPPPVVDAGSYDPGCPLRPAGPGPADRHDVARRLGGGLDRREEASASRRRGRPRGRMRASRAGGSLGDRRPTSDRACPRPADDPTQRMPALRGRSSDLVLVRLCPPRRVRNDHWLRPSGPRRTHRIAGGGSRHSKADPFQPLRVPHAGTFERAGIRAADRGSPGRYRRRVSSRNGRRPRFMRGGSRRPGLARRESPDDSAHSAIHRPSVAPDRVTGYGAWYRRGRRTGPAPLSTRPVSLPGRRCGRQDRRGDGREPAGTRGRSTIPAGEGGVGEHHAGGVSYSRPSSYRRDSRMGRHYRRRRLPRYGRSGHLCCACGYGGGRALADRAPAPPTSSHVVARAFRRHLPPRVRSPATTGSNPRAPSPSPRTEPPRKRYAAAPGGRRESARWTFPQEDTQTNPRRGLPVRLAGTPPNGP